MLPVLSISKLTKNFGNVTANSDVSLNVHPGEVVGLLGHNGAGKTTLVNQIVGLLRPDSGTIQIGAIDAIAQPTLARQHVAVQAQSTAAIDGLTPQLAIELAARMRGLSRRDAKSAATTLIDELDLGPWRNRRAGVEGTGLSGGIRRLTSFAMALAAPTPLLVLDEPTNDVDAARRRLLWDAVRRRGDNGTAVLVVTHNIVEAERVVDSLVLLHRGTVITTGSPGALRANERELRLDIQLRSSEAELPAPFKVSSKTRNGNHLAIIFDSSLITNAVNWANSLRNTEEIVSFNLGPTTLEDTYLTLTDAAERSTHHA